MADNSQKLSQLPQVANVASTDRVLVLRDPSGSPSTRTITVANLSNCITISNTVPANSSSTGIAGSIAYDANYFYVCTANNIWKRSALTTW